MRWRNAGTVTVWVKKGCQLLRVEWSVVVSGVL
jgi:hypothetical protein